MKRSCFIIVLFVSFLLWAGGVQARITLPSFFSDGMVLQQQSSVAIWGNSDRKLQKVTVKTSWNNKKYTVTTDESGSWKVKVETPVYGGPYHIEVSDGETVRINDVLIGEVWLCSGQSNMDMRVGGRYSDPVTGPLYKSMQTEGNKIILSFDEMGKGLTTYRQPLNGFEVAGEDRVFHPAHARFGKDAQTVIVSSPEVEQPVAVRYAFKDYVKGWLYNMSGLPASSFRTDNW